MKILSKIYNILIFAFLYVPIIVLIVFSFNSDDKNRTTFKGFTLKWYSELFKDEAILNALALSLTIAVLAAIISTVIGTVAAVGLKYVNKKLRSAMMSLNNIPMVCPEIVTGVSFMLLFVAFGKLTGSMTSLGFGSLLLAHISFCIPYVVLSVLPKMRQMNPHIYEAAQDLGCPPVKAFFKVVLPEIMPGVITGMMMAFTLSLDDFVISYFLSGSGSETLPVYIYSQVRKGVSNKIYALTALMFIVVMALLVIVNYMQISQDAKARKNAGRA